MPPDESTYPGDWFRIGDKELQRARYLLEGADFEGAGFNIQQAVEKYLKGFLLSRGWKLRRIHDLEVLINETLHYGPSLEEFRAACQKINRYYVRDRYPLMFRSELLQNEIRESYAWAEQIIAKIKAIAG